MTRSLALDLDGVLADLHSAMIEHTKFTRSDFEQWDKPDYNTFISEASRVWDEHWDDISSVEHDIDMKTDVLTDYFDVDIVTNTVGSDDVVTSWLDTHGVQYNDLVRPYSMGGDKPDLSYDAYVDDNPGMAGEVPVLYLRDQPMNQSVRGNGPYIYHSYEDSYIESEGPPMLHYASPAPHVVRVTGLNDVIRDIPDELV